MDVIFTVYSPMPGRNQQRRFKRTRQSSYILELRTSCNSPSPSHSLCSFPPHVNGAKGYPAGAAGSLVVGQRLEQVCYGMISLNQTP